MIKLTYTLIAYVTVPRISCKYRLTTGTKTIGIATFHKFLKLQNWVFADSPWITKGRFDKRQVHKKEETIDVEDPSWKLAVWKYKQMQLQECRKN